MLRRTFVLAAALGLVVWMGQARAEKDKDAPGAGTHEGKVVKVDGNKLTMTNKAGKNEHTHMVPADAKVTWEGKDAKLADLKAGSMVKVTAEKKGDKVVVTKVEAKKGE